MTSACFETTACCWFHLTKSLRVFPRGMRHLPTKSWTYGSEDPVIIEIKQLKDVLISILSLALFNLELLELLKQIFDYHDSFFSFYLFIFFQIKFGKAEFKAGSVQYERKNDLSLYIIVPAVIVPMLLIITISVYCYR